ncbi:MAG: hypothetical protein K8R36_17520 [Planctomycetales bacterium]|nr:hypothetical protein [Planctomycetales bacterium]
MFSPRLTSSLAARIVGGILLSALAGCCCQPVCQNGDGCLAGGMGPDGHHRVLRRGTLPPPVPAPAVASPIPRFHPLPTHPVFESQATYSPLVPVSSEPELPAHEMLAPRKLPKIDGEPTPALLPPEPVKQPSDL